MTFASDPPPSGDDDGFSVTSSLDIPTSPSSTTTTKATAHPRYYVHDDLSVFLVANKVLFRVHRYFLDRESAKFRSFPTGTDDNPVELKDVCPDEFVALLEYFYDGVHGDMPRSIEEWKQLLSISHAFEMEKVHNRAVRELQETPLDSVEKVVLAVKYGVDEWLETAYVKLCMRKSPIQEEEAQKLGLGTTVKLAQAREEFRERAVVDESDVPHHQDCFGFPTQPQKVPKKQDNEDVRARQVVAEVFWPAAPKEAAAFIIDNDGLAEGTKIGKGKKKQNVAHNSRPF